MAGNRSKMPPAEMPVEHKMDGQEDLNEAAAVAPAPVFVPKVKGAEVIAIRPGFYKGDRRREGEVFHLYDISKVGDWMAFSDPKMEADRRKLEKEKKKAASK